MTYVEDASSGAAAGRRSGRQWGLIVVGTDGSDHAARAIDAAVGLAAELDAELWIVAVIDANLKTAARQFARAEDGSTGDAAEALARGILNKAAHCSMRFAPRCAPGTAPRNC